MEGTDTPIRTVGVFLCYVFRDHSLPCRSSVTSPGLRIVSATLPTSCAINFTQNLYFCPSYTQRRLIQVIISLYSGVPESFEVFRCHPTTSEEELNLFFLRASKYFRHYVILEVNRLPYKLQEVYLYSIHDCSQGVKSLLFYHPLSQ